MPLQSPHGWLRLLMKWNILIGVTYESEFAPIQTAKEFLPPLLFRGVLLPVRLERGGTDILDGICFPPIHDAQSGTDPPVKINLESPSDAPGVLQPFTDIRIIFLRG